MTENVEIQEIGEPKENPLLGRIRIPGETFTLPSGGVMYTNGELDGTVRNGEIHVYPMTAIDEIIIRTPDKLFSGDAVKEVFGRCIPQILKPEEIFQRDVDFLMVALRKVSYGEQFDVTFKHDCEDAKEHTYRIEMMSLIHKTKSLDPTSIHSDFTVSLGDGKSSKQEVKLHPIRYKDVIKLIQALQAPGDLTPEQQRDYLDDSLLGIIESVDEIVDKGMIREWLDTIPVGWAHQISDAIDATADWGPDFTVEDKCRDCGEKIEISAPMNPITFFT